MRWLWWQESDENDKLQLNFFMGDINLSFAWTDRLKTHSAMFSHRSKSSVSVSNNALTLNCFSEFVKGVMR